jgi:hypothetical protein
MLRNEVLFVEWDEALRVYEKRKSGAVRTNSSRTAHDERTETERPADTQTQTLTSTETGTKEQSTLALTSIEVPAGVFAFPLPGQQGEWSLPQSIYDEMVRAYPGVNVMTQLSKMRAWLVSNPQSRKTVKGLPRFINTWLGKEQDKTGGFNGRGNSANGRAERNAEAVRAALGDA